MQKSSLLLFIAGAIAGAHGASRDYYTCNMTCPGGETWSVCRSERCATPALAEDACADGSEPAATTELVPGPLACAPLPAGSFAERCVICVGLARAALDAARHDAACDDAVALCAQAATAAAATELPTYRTCRMDPEGCASLLAQLSESTCQRAAVLIAQGAGRAAVLREAQRVCGEELRQRHNTTVSEAMVCEAPRDIGFRVMAISASVAAAVLSAQVAPAWLTSF